MIRDMTAGNPSNIIISYSVPIVLSGMFQQFYNIADSLIAGKYAGVNALAAVGASYPITMLFIAVATGAGMGCSVVISQIFGEKNYRSMKTAASTAVFSMLFLSMLLTAVGLLANNVLMKLMNTPGEVFKDGALYLRIYFCGLLFLFLYNISTAIFNGLGDSRTPLYFLIFSSLFNIILDYVFVAVLHMGVAGVAWATFIAQGISSVLSAVTLLHRLRAIVSEGKTQWFEKALFLKMSRIAVPSIIQQSVVSIGQLLVQALVNSYGASVIAGYSAAIKLDSFFKMTIISISNGVSSFTAQNAGARKLDRVKKGGFAAGKMCLLYSVVSVVIVRIAGKFMIGWFISADTSDKITKQVLSVGTTYMNVVTLFYFACAVLLICNGVMRGTGYMCGFTVTTFTDLTLRVAGAYILAYFIGYNAIWWSIPIGWTVGMCIALCFILKGKWKKAWES